MTMAKYIILLIVVQVTLTRSQSSININANWNKVKDPRWDEPQGTTYEVSSDSDINNLNSQLQPGDVMVMKSGEWTDPRITITASGRNERGYRIYLVPEDYGAVRLTGKVQIIFEGENIEVRGLWIDGISDDKITPVLFEESSSRCRFTDSAITNFNREVHDKNHYWVEAWGSYHKIDWNSFEEKVGSGQIVRVMAPEGTTQLPPGDEPPSWGATIAHNYFGPRDDTGEDDEEAVEIGLRTTEWSRLATTVERNYFYQYDGNIESVSVKGSNNNVRYNTFEECASTVTLRHGDYNRVEENYFLCNEKDSCGGVRVFGDHHEVINNYIEKENGRSNIRGGIVLQAGPSGSEVSRPAKNCRIEDNLLVDCRTCIYAGAYGSSGGGGQPDNVHYRRNIMTAASSSDYVLRETDEGQTSPLWKDNIGYRGIIDNDSEYGYGIQNTNPNLSWDSGWGIYRPGTSGLDFNMRYRPLTRGDVGPSWK